MPIDSKSMVPRYYQIFEELYKEITEGNYKEGDKFPSDTELVKKYDVSRGTIREALKILFQRGLLVRKQGKGSFITYSKIEQDAKRLMGFTELMKSHGKEPSAKILEITTKIPSRRIQSLLHLTEDDKVVKIQRLRFGDKEPLIVERSYFSFDLFKDLLKFDFEKESIYHLLYNNTDIRLGEAKQTIEAIAAGQRENELLKVEHGTPLLLIKRIIKTMRGKYFQYSEDVYRSDKLVFSTVTESYDEFHNELGLPLYLNSKD